MSLLTQDNEIMTHVEIEALPPAAGGYSTSR